MRVNSQMDNSRARSLLVFGLRKCLASLGFARRVRFLYCISSP